MRKRHIINHSLATNYGVCRAAKKTSEKCCPIGWGTTSIYQLGKQQLLGDSPKTDYNEQSNSKDVESDNDLDFVAHMP